MAIFEWGAALNALVNDVEAQIAGEEIARVKSKNGGQISARQLWESQKAKRSKLHKAFEWDDEVAGAKYRDRQAGELIRSIKVVYENEQGKELKVRAFSSIRNPEQPCRSVYVETISAMENEDTREEILTQALNGLVSWRNRWNGLNELVDSVAEVDVVIANLRKNAKKIIK